MVLRSCEMLATSGAAWVLMLPIHEMKNTGPESFVSNASPFARPLVLALLLALACNKEQQECSADADCGEGSYCEMNLRVCFGLPEASLPHELGTVPPSPSNSTTLQLVGMAEPDVTVYIHDEPTCQNLYLGRVVAGADGKFAVDLQVAQGETKTFYMVAQKVQGHATPCAPALTYVNDIGIPAVVSCPGDDQKALPPSEPVKVTFSEPVRDSTADQSALTLKSGEEVVKGTYTVDGPTMTFTPEKALGFKKSYTLSVTSGVQDVATNPATAKQCSFRTETTRWTAPQSVGIAQNANKDGLSFALTPSGTVFLGWTEGNKPNAQDWAARQVGGGNFERKQLAAVLKALRPGFPGLTRRGTGGAAAPPDLPA